MVGTQSVLESWLCLFSQATVVWFPPSHTSTSWSAVLPYSCNGSHPTPKRWFLALMANGEGQSLEDAYRDFQVLLH